MYPANSDSVKAYEAIVDTPTVKRSYTDTMVMDNVVIYADPRVERLLEIKTINQKEYPGIMGFRIQLFYGSGARSRKQAGEVQAEFLKLYPQIGCYEVFQTPNFKVRVGDFRTKLEAKKFLNDLREDFPDAYIVKDKIQLPDLGDKNEKNK